MDQTNIKILVGSIDQAVNKLPILGTINPILNLVNILITYIDYCSSQNAMGNSEYYLKAKQLNEILIKLKYKCSDICTYKNKVVISQTNFAPLTIDAGPDISIVITNTANITEAFSTGGAPPINYFWEQIAGVTAPIVNGNTLTPSIGPLNFGNVDMRVTATDAQGNIATDTMSILVAT